MAEDTLLTIAEGTTNPNDAQQDQTPSSEDQKPTQTADGQQKTDDTQQKPAEQDITISLPDGVVLPEEATAEFTTTAKTLGLTQDQAQGIMDYYAKSLSKANADADAAFDKTVETWETTAKADKEFGGPQFQENLAVAVKALDRFGTPELRQMLGESRLGSHPEVIRFVYRVGKSIAEDRIETGGPGDGGGRTAAQTLYPSMK